MPQPKRQGVEANGAKAAELYEKAMASDDFETRNVARFNLGRMYNRGAEGLAADIKGKGCEQDFAKAFELFSQDARGGRRAA